MAASVTLSLAEIESLLADALGGTSLVEAVGDSQVVVDFLTGKIKKFPKGTSSAIQLAAQFAKLSFGKQKTDALIKAKGVERQQIFQNRLEEISARVDAKVAERASSTASQVALGEARTGQAVARAEQLPPAQARGAIEAENVRLIEEQRRAAAAAEGVPQVTKDAAEREIRALERDALAKRRALPDPDLIDRRVAVGATGGPELEARANLAKTEIDVRRARAVDQTFVLAERVDPRLLVEGSEAKQRIAETARTRGFSLTQVELRKASEIVDFEQRAVKLAASQGLVLTEGKLSGAFRSSTTPGFGSAGKTATEEGLKLVDSLAKAGKIQEAEGALGRTLKTLKGAKLGRGGLLAGGGAALLALLLGGRGKEQEQNPALQIQLLQQLAEAQQKQQLTDSLVGSRQASSQRDLARAQLLRLQALSAAGGPAPAVV